MSLLLLVRHGDTEAVGRSLVGRSEGVPLSALGREQVAAQAGRLAELPLAAVYSSSLQRTCETAAMIAAPRGLDVVVEEAFNEVDFGHWRGRSFAQLRDDPKWLRYNCFRAGNGPPGGELPAQVQARMVRGLLEVCGRHPRGAVVVVVGHADPIRYALAWFAGIPVDLMLRIDIDPGSVSALALDGDAARVRCLNHAGPLPMT